MNFGCRWYLKINVRSILCDIKITKLAFYGNLLVMCLITVQFLNWPIIYRLSFLVNFVGFDEYLREFSEFYEFYKTL